MLTSLNSPEFSASAQIEATAAKSLSALRLRLNSACGLTGIEGQSVFARESVRSAPRARGMSIANEHRQPEVMANGVLREAEYFEKSLPGTCRHAGINAGQGLDTDFLSQSGSV